MKIEEIEASKVTVRLKTTNGIEFFMVVKKDESGIDFYSIDDHLVGINTKAKPITLFADDLYKLIEEKKPEGGLKEFGERSVSRRRQAAKLIKATIQTK